MKNKKRNTANLKAIDNGRLRKKFKEFKFIPGTRMEISLIALIEAISNFCWGSGSGPGEK